MFYILYFCLVFLRYFFPFLYYLSMSLARAGNIPKELNGSRVICCFIRGLAGIRDVHKYGLTWFTIMHSDGITQFDFFALVVCFSSAQLYFTFSSLALIFIFLSFFFFQISTSSSYHVKRAFVIARLVAAFQITSSTLVLLGRYGSSSFTFTLLFPSIKKEYLLETCHCFIPWCMYVTILRSIFYFFSFPYLLPLACRRSLVYTMARCDFTTYSLKKASASAGGINIII